ncbi:MAG: S8 family serine peptidase [Candidatus Latescibacterota bacterium]
MSLDFTRLSGRGVRVAVVDSGICPDHPRIGPVAGGVRLRLDAGGGITASGDWEDRAGHGTACAGIIHRKAPEAQLYAVALLDETLSADGRLLEAAVDWSVSAGMDVVNLSLGTTDVTQREGLEAACRRAVARGLILVAAEHNEGRVSYPAASAHTLGVTTGRFAGLHGYAYRPGQPSECVARGDPQRVCWYGPAQVFIGGTSLAAAHITGLVALIRQACPGARLEEVRALLAANALSEETGDGAGGLGARPAPPAAGTASRAGRRVPGVSPVSGHEPLSARAASGFGAAGSRERAARSLAEQPEPPASVAGAVSNAPQYCGSAAGPAFAVPLGPIQRAALYPFNKEMHALVRGRDLLGFEIASVADPPGKGLVGRDAGEALGCAPLGLRIVPRLQAALEGVDTLVLGCVDELSRLARRDLLREAAAAAIARGIHVFSLQAVPQAEYADLHAAACEQRVGIAWPNLSPQAVLEAIHAAERLPAVDRPVLGVFGTSAQQGKFTAQLALRRHLLRGGYRLGQVGTEPHAALFGMDLTFPMGYASPLEIPLQWYAPYLDARLRALCHERRPDVIVVGSQSGTVPFDVHEPSTHTLASLAFLLGTAPDACVLAVNPSDPEDYVRDTLDGIRALCGAPVIALVASDLEQHFRPARGRMLRQARRLDPSEVAQRLAGLEARYGLPAVCAATPEGEERLVRVVVEHFRSAPEGGE